MAEKPEKTTPVELKKEEAEAAPAKVEKAADKNEGLVKVKLKGEHLFIHPDVLQSHKAAGWEEA